MIELTTQQRRALRKHLRSAPAQGSLTGPAFFLLNYFFFESLIRILGQYYRARDGKITKLDAHESLNIDVVRRSFKYFGVRVPDDALDVLLNSKRMKRNQKSARKLRDGVVHNWNSGDWAELATRCSSLSKTVANAIAEIQRTANS